MTSIFASHLLNDYSGSPKVLSQLLKGWAAAGHQVNLRTSTSSSGFLTDIEGVQLHNNYYRFYRFIPIRLLVLMVAQFVTLLALLRKVSSNDIVYVNTLLPFGAAIAGRIKGARVIYHIHETSINPLVFKKFLLFWVRVCATEIIYVSDFLAQEEPIDKPSHILWNAIEDDFRKRANLYGGKNEQHGKVLMIASLKRYKGVDEFLKIAKACPELHFDLVVNATQEEIIKYFTNQAMPTNLQVFPAQRDVHPFYQQADIVMNLSRPDEWKETFGLTALEAMMYGLPVIVPPVGGIAEIVQDGITGYHIDGKDTDLIVSRLRVLSSAPLQYKSISRLAAKHAATFSEAQFLDQSLRLIERKNSRNRSRFPKNGTILSK